jgi:archaellum biogenesis ATPase FlaH
LSKHIVFAGWIYYAKSLCIVVEDNQYVGDELTTGVMMGGLVRLTVGMPRGKQMLCLQAPLCAGVLQQASEIIYSHTTIKMRNLLGSLF